MTHRPLRKQKKGFCFLFGSAVTKEMNLVGMKEEIRALIAGILLAGMKAHCVCVFVSVCEKTGGGNGIMGNTFGRARRAT